MSQEEQWTSLAQVEAITRLLVPWRSLDWPLDWTAQFGRPGKLLLEIGFGNGEFLAEMARKRPDRDLVGVEISWESVHRVLKRLQRGGLGNARVVVGDGSLVLAKLFPPDSIDEVYLNHPDPWNKSRHFKRVIVQPEFIELLASRLSPGGQLTIVTDHRKYADWIAGVLERAEDLESCFPSPYVHSLPDRMPTRYERKFLEAGQPIHYFVWRKPPGATRHSHAHELSERFGEMPNVLFQAEPEVGYLLRDLEPQTIHEPYDDLPVVIKLLHLYREEGSKNELVEMWVKEGKLTQQFGVAALKRGDGRVLVKLSALGYPRPTRGVKRAVWHVAQRILRANPSMTVLANSVGELARPTRDAPESGP